MVGKNKGGLLEDNSGGGGRKGMEGMKKRGEERRLAEERQSAVSE